MANVVSRFGDLRDGRFPGPAAISFNSNRGSRVVLPLGSITDKRFEAKNRAVRSEKQKLVGDSEAISGMT